MKKLRLIETFAGYGSQAMALKKINIPFEHHCISEWEVNANKAYKAIHCNDENDYSKGVSYDDIVDFLLNKLSISTDGKSPMTEKQIYHKGEKWCRQIYNEFLQTKNLGSVCNIHGDDLKIVDTDKYTYLLTYSFPCTDLSLAGRRAGMKKGSGTHSGLLWEIERILKELVTNKSPLPQILFMENVPQVISKTNMPDFENWLMFLDSIGYKSFYSCLNAKNYEIAQNRNRCYMFSFLKSEFGDNYKYEFPGPIQLTTQLKDYLEPYVDEKYYLSNKSLEKMNLDGLIKKTQNDEKNNFIDLNFVGGIGNKDIAKDGKKLSRNYPQGNRIYSANGISTSITSSGGGLGGSSGLYSVKEPFVVASRGRNPENPTDRTVGMPTQQRLEPNLRGICNTLTSFQKDNYVCTSQILTPKRTEYGKQIRKEYEKGNIKESRHNMIEPTPRKDGLCNTLTSVQKDNYVCEQAKLKRIGQVSCKGSQAGTVYSTDGLAPTMCAGVHGYAMGNIAEQQNIQVQTNNYAPQIVIIEDKTYIIIGNIYYRIRKLTPRECGRLMGVSDNDITKMEKILSNTTLYKLFGNSIVVNVMTAMFSFLKYNNF